MGGVSKLQFHLDLVLFSPWLAVGHDVPVYEPEHRVGQNSLWFLPPPLSVATWVEEPGRTSLHYGVELLHSTCGKGLVA